MKVHCCGCGSEMTQYELWVDKCDTCGSDEQERQRIDNWRELNRKIGEKMRKEMSDRIWDAIYKGERG